MARPSSRNTRPGDVLRIERPQKPFQAVVERVNAKSVTVRDDRGKRWRVNWYYPMSFSRGRRQKAAPARPATRRRAPARPARRAPARRASSGAGTTKPRSAPRSAQVIARGRELLAQAPRERAHFMEGGSGVSGWLWFRKKGMGKFIVADSGNGMFSEHTMSRVGQQLEREFGPGAYTYFNYD